MIEFRCPNCGHMLRISAKYSGGPGRCKYCKHKFEVPSSIPTPIAGQAPAAGPDDPTKLANGAPVGVDPGPSFEELMADAGLPVMDAIGLEPIDSFKPPEGGLASAPAGLGCFFWALVFLFPPAGLVWGVFVPSGHPEKIRGIITSVVMLLVAAGIFAGSYALTKNADLQLPSVSELSTLPTLSGGLSPISRTQVDEDGVPQYPGLVLAPADPITFDDGPLMDADPSGFDFRGGYAEGDYFDIANFYDLELGRLGWSVGGLAGFDENRGRYSVTTAEKDGAYLYVEVIETDTGAYVTVAKPR